MQRLQKSILTAVVMSEVAHVFCCVLPIVFSLFSLMAGLGVIGVMPQVLTDLHEIMHGYELPMIIMSALILVFGWGMYAISRKLDCHNTGCGHGPCGPRKDKAHIILKVATILFIFNATIYTVFHRASEVPLTLEQTQGAPHDHAHGHDHGQNQ